MPSADCGDFGMHFLGETMALQLPANLKKPIPHGLKPMLATLIDGPFDSPDYIYEIKWDGFRAIAETGTRSPAFYSRNMNSYSSRFPLIAKELKGIRRRMILDGEVVAFNDEGKPSFQLIKTDPGPQDRIFYYVFDLLYIDGYDLRSLPLLERKRILEANLPELERIRYCDHVHERGTEFFNLIAQQQMEGVIAKVKDAPYADGKRTRYWLKIKTEQRVNGIIVGYTEPRGGRKHLGALVLAVRDGDRLRYIGHTGTGFSHAQLGDMLRMLEPISIDKPPVYNPPKTPRNDPIHWVKPRYVCEAKFLEWTNDGHMRHPVFAGLRNIPPEQAILPEAG